MGVAVQLFLMNVRQNHIVPDSPRSYIIITKVVTQCMMVGAGDTACRQGDSSQDPMVHQSRARGHLYDGLHCNSAGNCGMLPCCAVLRCAVLCCAVPRCAMLCCAVLCYAVLPCYAGPPTRANTDTGRAYLCYVCANVFAF